MEIDRADDVSEVPFTPAPPDLGYSFDVSAEGTLPRLGRYHLKRKLAQGGMADVFFAEREGDAGVIQPVALKRLRRHLVAEAQFVAMFLDEARLAARLTHQNVAQVIDFGSVEGEYFLAMEYLDGVSLHAALKRAVERRAPVPSDIAVAIMARALDGLHYAHTLTVDGQPLHIVHRDISLSNIFVTWSGNVKVIDFGIARASNRQQEDTSTGIFKGKLSYASPEHLAGEVLDARSDVFSAGIVAWELLTGQRLFRRPTEMATMHAITAEPIPSVRGLRPDLPAGVDQVLARALDRDRSSRFASAQEFRRALEALQPPATRVDDWLAGLFSAEERSSGSPPASPPGPVVAEPVTRTSARLGPASTTPATPVTPPPMSDVAGRPWWAAALVLSALLVLVLSGLVAARRRALERVDEVPRVQAPAEDVRGAVMGSESAVVTSDEPVPSPGGTRPAPPPSPPADDRGAVIPPNAPPPGPVATSAPPEAAPAKVESPAPTSPQPPASPKARPTRPSPPTPKAPEDNPLTL
jgi:eukaryotic-like serine/threonine-protein kinase